MCSPDDVGGEHDAPMQILPVEAGSDRSRALVELETAMTAVDAPWSSPPTETTMDARLRYGWDGEPPTHWIGVVGDVVVAGSGMWASNHDNLDSAGLGVAVHPEHRRRGYGSAMLAHLHERAREGGRLLVSGDAWDTPASDAFATHHGYVRKSVGVIRRQQLADVPEGWRADAERARTEDAADYELLEWDEVAPADHDEAVVALWADINDAPHDDLEMEDEVFSVERIRGYERAQRAAGRRLHHVVARHRGTGALAGHTIVAVEAERPEQGHQHDTTVARAHRGHRLGLVLKSAMLDRLSRLEPQLTYVDTWNAESNDHMIAVNEQLGYRVMARSIAYQRRLG
jgi:GNAT superfamily N-acetyltransferase